MSFWQAFRATLRSILRDRGLLQFFILAVPFYSLFYPAAYSTEAVRGIRVEVVDLDGSTLSRQLTRDLAASPGVTLLGNVATVEEARQHMADGKVAGVVIIPADFYRDVLRSQPTTVVTWGTGAFPVQDKAVLESVGAVVQGIARQASTVRMVRQGASGAYARQGASQPPAYIEQALFNVTRGYGSYVVAAVAILIVQQVLLIGIAALMGTWIERRAPPLFDDRPHSLPAVVGVWAALSLMVFPAFLYMFGFAFWFQDYPRGGNVLAAIAFAGLAAPTIAAFGMSVGALFANRERPLQVILATSIPLLFLSGAVYPREAIPVPLKALAALVPSTPGINGFIKLNQMGALWREIKPEVFLMTGLMLLYCLIAWLLLSWRAGHLSGAVLPAETEQDPQA